MNSAQSTGLKQKNPFEHKIWNCTNHTGLQFFKVYKRCHLLRNCFSVSIRNSSVQDFSPVLVTTMFFLFPHWKMLRLSFSTGRAVHKCHCVTSPLSERVKGLRMEVSQRLEKFLCPLRAAWKKDSQVKGVRKGALGLICSVQNHLFIPVITKLLELP